MKLSHSLMLLFALSLSVSLACHRQANNRLSQGGGHDHDHDHDDDGHEGMIPLSDVPGVRIQAVAEPKELSLWHPGIVIADESSQFVLSSPVSGILGNLRVPPGRQVAAGTPLAEVNSPELARLYSDWLAAKAVLTRAEANLAREQRLDASKATSQRDLEEAISEVAVAKAEEESSRLALESLGIRAEQGGATWVIRAPRGGAVVDYKAISGQGVGAGEELGSFLATGSVIVRMELDPASAGNWSPGHTFTVQHPSGIQWNGRLEGIVPALSADTMRQTYRLRLSGSSLPIPGTPVEVQLPFPPAITLPQAALQQVDGQWGVFITHHGYAEFRPVVRGRVIKDEVVILEGLRPGRMVAVEGAYLLKAYQRKLASSDEDHGHVH